MKKRKEFSKAELILIYICYLHENYKNKRYLLSAVKNLLKGFIFEKRQPRSFYFNDVFKFAKKYPDHPLYTFMASVLNKNVFKFADLNLYDVEKTHIQSYGLCAMEIYNFIDVFKTDYSIFSGFELSSKSNNILIMSKKDITVSVYLDPDTSDLTLTESKYNRKIIKFNYRFKNLNDFLLFIDNFEEYYNLNCTTLDILFSN